jgi:hypothetical protein
MRARSSWMRRPAVAMGSSGRGGVRENFSCVTRFVSVVGMGEEKSVG